MEICDGIDNDGDGEIDEGFDSNGNGIADCLEVYDLALEKSLNTSTAAPFSAGDEVTFDITITNQGNIPSGIFTVIDYVPTGLTFTSATVASAMSNGNVVLSIPNIVAGASFTVSVTFTIDTPFTGSIENWAEVETDNGDDADSTP